VRALRKLHTALRPQGVLLDIHPEPEHSLIEIRRTDQTIAVGQVDQTQDIGDITGAEAALRQALDERLFAAEGERTFDFVRHFDSVETWLAYRVERQSAGTIVQEVLDCGRALLAQAPGELCVRHAIRAARYRKA
jgi:hypothetical protein